MEVILFFYNNDHPLHQYINIFGYILINVEFFEKLTKDDFEFNDIFKKQ